MPRPKKPADEPGLVNLSASIPEDLMEKLNAHAKRVGLRSRSNAVALLLARALDAEQPRVA